MDRKIYKLPFFQKSISRYRCPSCEKGDLQVKDGTFNQSETEESLASRDEPAWEAAWIEYVYSCLFECNNAACNSVVSSTGKGHVDEDYDYDEDGQLVRDYSEYYIPEYFIPHLKIFGFQKGVPEGAVREINKSFTLLFSDPPSSANHVRVALEHLLTHLKISRYRTKNGKRHFLSLHSRIDLLPKKYEHVKDIFLAVKWLGNAGSHSNHEVTLDDVLDSYELTIELLDEIFSDKRTKAKALARKINKKKGPK